VHCLGRGVSLRQVTPGRVKLQAFPRSLSITLSFKVLMDKLPNFLQDLDPSCSRMAQRIVLVLLAVCELGRSFLMSSGFLKPTRKYGIISGFEAKDLEELVKPIGTVLKSPTIDPASFSQYNLSTAAKAANASEGDVEKVFRTYPFEDLGLPLLQDHNNYYSGSFKDMFWQQNADNFFLFVPIGDDIERRDIHVQFEALSVCVKIRGEIVAQFPCEQRLIPAGSFWLFDKDVNNQRYLHLDIEKRYRMINWNKLFGEPETLSASERLAAKSKVRSRLVVISCML